MVSGFNNRTGCPNQAVIKMREIPFCRLLILLLPLLLSAHGSKGQIVPTSDIKVVFDPIIVSGIVSKIDFKLEKYTADSITIDVGYDNKVFQVMLVNGLGALEIIPKPHKNIEITLGNTSRISENRAIPLWYSVIPPLLAILFALIFREVFTALILGLLSGTFMIAWYGGNGIIPAMGAGLLRIIDTYIIRTISDPDHVAIIVFSFMIGGMVQVISSNGGMRGVVNHISRFANSRKSTLFSTWLLGILVFFDDYANTLVVGNTMRPLTDRMKISREKLSYIVDSTAAPVSAIAFITTWIGAELSYIKNAVDVINTSSSQPISEGIYSMFFQSLSYSFYPFLTLGFVVIIVLTGRDFGSMYRAEKAALLSQPYPVDDNRITGSGNTADLQAETVRPRAFNAIIPVITVILGAFTGLLITGLEKVPWDYDAGFGTNLSDIVGHADSFRSLLWASFSGLLVAVILSFSQRIMSLQKAVDSAINGFKTMLSAMLILILAWSLAILTMNLHTAEFLSLLMLQLEISPPWIPVITFILAGLVSFSTGSSWGTMAILYPLLLPTSWHLFSDYQLNYQESMVLFHVVVASVLAGSVFGDHCSPISDTTILSSLATGCNHVEHVRTQLPYAISVGIVSILAGIIPVSFGLNPLAAFLFALVLLFLIIRFVGKRLS